MSLRKLMITGTLALSLALASVAGARAESPTPLAQKMRVMAAAMKNLAHPGVPPAAANPLDDLKLLKDAATDCHDHSDDLAPPPVAQDPEALKAFKAEFTLLLTKIDGLERALQLPADAPNRDAQVKAALSAVLSVKKDGHNKFNSG